MSTEDALMKGYDSVANPDKQEAEQSQPVEKPEVEAPPVVEPPAVPTVEETPPPAEAQGNDQIKDLLAQVSRIPELEKQIRDSGGRYGALKQSIEQLQQRIASTTTQAQAEQNTQDAGELLAELNEDYPELAEKLKGAFAKVMAARGGQTNPESIKQAFADYLEADRKRQTAEGEAMLDELHPGWKEVRDTPEFSEWTKTLSKHDQMLVKKSEDPFVAAKMLDRHAEWLKSKTKPAQEPHTKPVNKRLVDAVLPTTNARPAQRSEPSANEMLLKGYNRVAGARIT